MKPVQVWLLKGYIQPQRINLLTNVILKKMKKKILIGIAALAIAAVAALNISLNSQKDAFALDIIQVLDDTTVGAGVSCYCGKIYGKGCKADNSGSSCNPEGSSKCWEYDRNCS